MEDTHGDDLELAAEGPRFWTRDTLRQVVERVLEQSARFQVLEQSGDGLIHPLRHLLVVLVAFRMAVPVVAVEVARLGSGSYPLGIKKNIQYASVTTCLAPGEALLFHSDGLPEARGSNGEEFGDAHIEHLLFRRSGARPYELVAALVQDLDLFLGRAAAEDDVSIAVIRRKSA